MTKRNINAFVTLTGTKSVKDWDSAVRAEVAKARAKAERKARLAEEARIEAELVEWLADPANADSPEYSDVFKDVYGFRPR